LSQEKRGLDLYKEAGVDVDKGDRLVDWLKESESSSHHRYGRVVSGIGGFSGLFRPDFSGMKDPLLVSGTDGVGTKVLLAIESGLLEGLGLDLVAMCVNDLYTIGARPLFFLDYYATGRLDEAQFKAVLTGIRRGCVQSGAALMGGETAEMPGLYEKGHFDLAGFVVGVVDGARALGPERVKAGDLLYALESSGFHSNGYSLVRHWLKQRKAPASPALLAQLMAPTRIYHEIPAILDEVSPETLHALANITGGGISGNLPRVIPDGLVCRIDAAKLRTPDWMRAFIAESGSTPLEQEAVFNLGAGMIAAVAPAGAAAFERVTAAHGVGAYPIGRLEARPGEASVEYT
jgi:phosphoribosylformylglycinamidine cyclo-ligase